MSTVPSGLGNPQRATERRLDHLAALTEALIADKPEKEKPAGHGGYPSDYHM